MGIKNLVPRLPERGKIKIGMLGEEKKSSNGNYFRMPQKLDHFIITHTDRGPDGNFLRDNGAHEALGDKPTELPVRLLYDDPDLNFPTRYAAYKGRTLWCSGDGETADRLSDDGKSRTQVKCTCERADPAYTGPDKCKMNGALSVLLDLPDRAGVGGVWSFRTTSYNSIVSIMSSLQFLRAMTAGPLAGIPMRMRVQAKEGTTPDGKKQTVHFVSIEYPGSEEDLIERGQKVALHRATAKMSIEHIEDQARQALRLTSPDVVLAGDENENIVDEFYPEQVEDIPPRPTRGQQPDASPEPVESKAEPVDTFDLVDETGEIILETVHPGEWVDAYSDGLRRARGDEVRAAFIDNNHDTWSVIIDEDLVVNARDIHRDLHPQPDDGPPVEDGDPGPYDPGFPGDDPEPGTIDWSILVINRTTSKIALETIVDLIKQKYWADYTDDQKRTISAAKLQKQKALQ